MKYLRKIEIYKNILTGRLDRIKRRTMMYFHP